MSDRYKYSLRHAGSPALIETGDLWLSESVPFGLVRQQAISKDESGKAISKFEMLLTDSGVSRSAEGAASARAPDAAAVRLADAFRTGKVELAVSVSPNPADGSSLSVTFKNKTAAPLRVDLPAGATTLDVGTPVDKLQIVADTAKTIDMGPNQTSAAIALRQTGPRRAVKGTFTLSVYEGTPLYSGSVTMDSVR